MRPSQELWAAGTLISHQVTEAIADLTGLVRSLRSVFDSISAQSRRIFRVSVPPSIAQVVLHSPSAGN